MIRRMVMKTTIKVIAVRMLVQATYQVYVV